LNKIHELEQFCISHCNEIITPSQVTQLFIKQYIKDNNKTIHIIPNGVRIDWFYEQDKSTLASHIKAAQFTVAPLSACDRNIMQGCNPLKIIESMAYGTTVVASNIPVVRELIVDDVSGILVPPDRPELLGRKMRMLLEAPETLARIGKQAKAEIDKNYLWLYQEGKMKKVYQNLLNEDLK